MATLVDVFQLATSANIDAAVAQIRDLKAEIEDLVAGVGTGKSAYQSWLDVGHPGYTGPHTPPTEADFIDSLKGTTGTVVDWIGVSTTSVAVGTGSKSFTTETGLAYAVGSYVRIASASSPTTFMAGTVTAYNSTTGALTVTVDTVNGSGTFASWNIVPAGAAGPAGIVDYTAISNNVGIVLVKFDGTAWQTRASRVPAGYTGIVLYWSVAKPGAAAPTDRTGNNDYWAEGV